MALLPVLRFKCKCSVNKEGYIIVLLTRLSLVAINLVLVVDSFHKWFVLIGILPHSKVSLCLHSKSFWLSFLPLHLCLQFSEKTTSPYQTLTWLYLVLRASENLALPMCFLVSHMTVKIVPFRYAQVVTHAPKLQHTQLVSSYKNFVVNVHRIFFYKV